jgi:hypothetical protein
MTPDIVTEMADLLRRGRLTDLHARAERVNSPMIAILRARALIAQGYAAGPDRKGGTAEAILKKLENDPDGDVALLAQIELLHAQYVGAMMGDSRAPAIHEATALGRRAGSRPGVQTAVLFLSGYLAGQLAIRARRFDVGRDELQKVEKLARCLRLPKQRWAVSAPGRAAPISPPASSTAPSLSGTRRKTR